MATAALRSALLRLTLSAVSCAVAADGPPNHFSDLPIDEFLPPPRAADAPLYVLRLRGGSAPCLGAASVGQLAAADATCAARWTHEGGAFVLASEVASAVPLCLDVFAAEDALGVYPCHGGQNQRFVAQPQSATVEGDVYCGTSGRRLHCLTRQQQVRGGEPGRAAQAGAPHSWLLTGLIASLIQASPPPRVGRHTPLQLAARCAWPRMCTSQALVVGGPIRRGDESIMARTRPAQVQESLRWGVSRDLAESISNLRDGGAEPNMHFTECVKFTQEMRWQRGVDMSKVEPITFYDSVSGAPLFVAPRERTMDDFLSESLRHGWPSFRPSEVVWENVRVLDDEVVSTAGTHLGHSIPDGQGPRFCINLCCVAGLPAAAAEPSGEEAGGEAVAGERLGFKAAWPLLHELAAVGEWSGTMHYATGADGLTPAPFVLTGTTCVSIESSVCSLTSSVTLPNGVERTVCMEGVLPTTAGETVRLEKASDADAEDAGDGGGPISLLLSEQAGADAILVRELNRTTGAPVLTSSLVLVRDTGGAPVEVIQTAHELTQEGGGVSGVQIWRMVPGARFNANATASARSPAVRRTPRPPLAEGEQNDDDEETYMYSGSEL